MRTLDILQNCVEGGKQGLRSLRRCSPRQAFYKFLKYAPFFPTKSWHGWNEILGDYLYICFPRFPPLFPTRDAYDHFRVV